MDLSEVGFLRIWHIIGDPDATPPIQPLYPVGKSTLWLLVKSGRFPKPVKLGPRTTAWKTADVRSFLEAQK
ncbi:MAG: AlpA family phage regulatory protein [Candidatus Riflebacteria bacterium]|nr:AlpA family phage regulatory protein [Candidatus Riflebacteria bacterium]